jgi:hypothetical protein
MVDVEAQTVGLLVGRLSTTHVLGLPYHWELTLRQAAEITAGGKARIVSPLNERDGKFLLAVQSGDIAVPY